MLGKDAANRLMEDVLKLVKAQGIVEEVLEKLEDLTGINRTLPLMLSSANTELRNVTNCLKIVLNPEAGVSISIPMFSTGRDPANIRERSEPWDNLTG